ncbi:MAG: hypothetical protein ACR2PL_19775, partial [Dehalococcoidia bacterium]
MKRKTARMMVLLTAIAMIAAAGAIDSLFATDVAAQAAKSCFGPGGTSPAPGQVDTCVVLLNYPGGLPSGASIQVTLNTPVASVSCSPSTQGINTVAGVVGTAPAAGGPNTCAFVNSSGSPLATGTAIGVESFTIPAGTAIFTPIVQTQAACSATSASQFGSTQCGSAMEQLQPGVSGLFPTGPGSLVGTGANPGGCIRGDANCDGKINAIDALCILRSVAGLPSTVVCPAIPIPSPS